MKTLTLTLFICFIFLSCDKTTNEARFEALEIGMTAEQVVDIVGEPAERHVLGYSKISNDTIIDWLYLNDQRKVLKAISFSGGVVNNIVLDYEAEQAMIKKLMKDRKRQEKEDNH